MKAFRLKSCMLLLICLFTYGPRTLAQESNDTYPSLNGSRHDGHGDIDWESSVKRDGPIWEFHRLVHNQGISKQCRVAWKTAQIEGTFVKPGGTIESTFRIPLRPQKFDGTIIYNCIGPGDATAAAPVWGPESKSPNASSKPVIQGRILLEFVFEGIAYKLHLAVKSQVRDEVLRTRSRDKRGYLFAYEVIADGAELLPKTLRIKWNSLESELMSSFLFHEQIAEKRFISFGKDGHFVVSFATQTEPVLNSLSIQILNGSQVIAEGWLPAYAPVRHYEVARIERAIN
jgi:hypothetical protein